MSTLLRSITALLTISIATSAMAKPISAVLRLKERVSVETLAQDVRTPVSSRFQHFYTPAEIRAISAPAEQDYQKLLTQLRTEGFTIDSESPTHLWIRISADSNLFDRVFRSQIQVLSAQLHRNSVAPEIPAHLSLVAAITGLDNTHKRTPRLIRFNHPMDAPSGVPQATIKTAYGFDPLYKAGLTGKGQHIAIATYDGLNLDDVKAFYDKSGISPAPAVDQVTFNGTPTYSEDSAMESQLDTEFSGMIAPGASIHVFASAENSDAGELAMFTSILDDNRSKVVNYSWGSCEPQLSSAHQAEMAKVFARAVAQGVNVMVASGDSGSDSCGDGTNKADWPAANNDVVAVGGTTFATDANGKIAESGWGGSGGGISDLWDLPAWQKQLGGQYVKRSYPDVSFNADPASGQAIYAHNGGTPDWIVIGGTSMAAPQWAGFMALVGEARQNAGKATLGFLNPVIYGLTDSARATAFHDVTSGSNGLFTAAAGWDAVTGWGSMQADALLQILSNN